MPKVSNFICDGSNGEKCKSTVNENGFSLYPTVSKNRLYISRGILDEDDVLYFCSEGCLLKFLTQAIRELK